MNTTDDTRPLLTRDQLLAENQQQRAVIVHLRHQVGQLQRSCGIMAVMILVLFIAVFTMVYQS